MMNTLSKYITPILILAGIGILPILVLRPAKISRANSLSVNATVTGISKGGLNDIIISLDRARGIFYIAKSASQNLDIDSLSKRLVGEQIIVFYSKPHFLSRLSPIADKKLITEILLGTDTVYALIADK